MSIDLSQFHQVFFEESFENMDVMENSLMELDTESLDSEVINSIFRAAHSVKGGSATFGFSAISDFTHILETLLDQVRAGDRSIDKNDVNLFLQSVDCIREMLTLMQAGEDGTTGTTIELSEKFNKILAGEEAPSDQEASAQNENAAPIKVESPESSVEMDSSKTWNIFFAPSVDILRSGNDPVRILRELSELGKLEVQAHKHTLPAFSSLDAEGIYLSWNLKLEASDEVCEKTVKEVFEWVEDESEIIISHGADEVSVPLESKEDQETIWSISFEPNADIFRTGNDPVRLIGALKDVGEIVSVSTHANFPEFNSMDPEQCFSKWEILLDAAPEDKTKIDEVFEWVIDESKVTIEPISGFFQTNQKNVSSVAMEAKAEVVEKAPKTPSKTTKPPADQRQIKKPAGAGDNSSIRVSIDKVDALINMVGELVITQSMLGQLGTDFDESNIPKLVEGLVQLEQNTRELQESVMRIRMLPISFVFSRFPRMVRDLSQNLGKEVLLDIKGDQTELDKTVLEKIGDPLVHIVRNAVDHGIESPEERAKKGKPQQGIVELNAYHQGGNVVIEVKDDGKGLNAEALKTKAIEKGLITKNEADSLTNEQAYELIFHAGFSTAETISDVSGRGVGMDVVKSNIQALNGAVELQSEIDVGSTLTIRLPLTLAILDGQLVRVADHTYIFPIVSIVESLQVDTDYVSRVAGGYDVLRLREEYVPIIHLSEVFGVKESNKNLEGSLVVVVESEGEKVGIVVEELLAQQQVVIKSLEQNYQRIRGISGGTILGDGRVALIVDMPGIVKMAGCSQSVFQNSAAEFSGQSVNV